MGSYNLVILESSPSTPLDPLAFREVPDRGTEESRSLARACLFVCAFVLVVGVLCDASEESAALFGIEGPQCLLRAFVGEHACPACGLTRSTAMSLQGRLSTAFATNAAGLLVALLALVGSVASLRVLLTDRGAPFLRLFARFAGPLLLIGALAAWISRLALGA